PRRGRRHRARRALQLRLRAGGRRGAAAAAEEAGGRRRADPHRPQRELDAARLPAARHRQPHRGPAAGGAAAARAPARGGQRRRPPPARSTAPPPVPGTAAEGGQSQVPLVLSLILVGGVLLLLSRFLIFESTYTVLAADFGGIGIHWISWLVGAALPLLVAFQL